MDYILGIGKSQDKVKHLLDIDQVLSTQEVVEIQDVHAFRKESSPAPWSRSEAARLLSNPPITGEPREIRRTATSAELSFQAG